MKLHLSATAALIALLVVSTAPPALSQPADLRPLFPSRADIHVSTGRLARIELAPEVLSACRADLSDLRIIDAAGREVPYRIDSNFAGGAERQVERSFPAELLEVDRQTIERDAGPPLRRETYELAAPPEPSRTGAWDLVFESRRPRFVRRVTLETRRSDGAVAVLRGASIFRLGSSSREKAYLTIEGGGLDRVIVTLEGEENFFLEPDFRYEESLLIPDERVAVELIEVGRSETAGQTTIELARPRGLVPAALQVATSTRTFNRRARVRDQGPGGGDRELGRRAVYRVPGFTTAEELEVPISPARGDRLAVVIDNGDSPPLEGLRFQAIVRRPALVFALEGTGPRRSRRDPLLWRRPSAPASLRHRANDPSRRAGQGRRGALCNRLGWVRSRPTRFLMPPQYLASRCVPARKSILENSRTVAVSRPTPLARGP